MCKGELSLHVVYSSETSESILMKFGIENLHKKLGELNIGLYQFIIIPTLHQA